MALLMFTLALLGSVAYGMVGIIFLLPRTSATLLRLIGVMLILAGALLFFSGFYHYAGGLGGDPRPAIYVGADVSGVIAMIVLFRQERARRNGS